jgi:hypothetical protein
MRNRDEPVRLTKIYTRGGDAGETSLGDGSRVSKLDPRIVAYGIVDELNSHIGLVLAGELRRKLRTPLARVQNELFDVGATRTPRTRSRAKAGPCGGGAFTPNEKLVIACFHGDNVSIAKASTKTAAERAKLKALDFTLGYCKV